MRTAFIVLVAMTAVSGCTWTYDKQGVTSAEVVADYEACRAVATQASLLSVTTISGDEHVTVPERRLNRDAFNRCMGERGYSAGMR